MRDSLSGGTLERGAARAMRWLSVGALVVTAITYLLTTFTPLGQAIADEAWLARVAEGKGLLKVSRHLLEFIDIGTIIGVIAILLVGTAVRGSWRVGAALAGGLLGAAASAELLKAALPRPDLAPQLEAMMGEHAANSFPSGHVTIATASVLAMIVVLPSAGRLPWAMLGAVLVASVACAVVAAGWHRPSDALGGLGWALAWQGLIIAGIVRRLGVAVPGSARTAWFWPTVAGLVLAAAVVILAVLGRVDIAGLTGSVRAWTFPIAEILLACTALLAINCSAWILRRVELR